LLEVRLELATSQPIPKSDQFGLMTIPNEPQAR